MDLKSLGRQAYLGTYRVLSGSGLYRFRIIRLINKSVLRLLRRKAVVVNGFTLFLDKRDSLNLSLNSNYEPEETKFVRETVTPGQTVVDIGANIGYYTCLMSKLVGESGKVYAFEPDKENFQLLRKNVETNGLRNVILENKAVADRTRELNLFYSNDKGDQRTYDTRDGRPSIPVYAVSLDDYFRQRGQSIGFIKMDIQGSEGEALLGMREVLQHHKGVKLSVEFWPVGLDKSGFGAKRFLETLKQLGMDYYDMHLPDSTWNNPDYLMKTYGAGKKIFTNLVCLPHAQ